MVRLFKPGDRVTPRSGGPVMEVIKYVEEDGLLIQGVSDRKVLCVWYDSQGRKKDVFYQNTLIPAFLVKSKTFSPEYENRSTIYGSFKNIMKQLTQKEALETFDQLSAALDFMNKYGYTAEFIAEKNQLVYLSNGKAYRPEEITIVRSFHFEGFTNVDDMAVLYALKADDNTKGWIANAHGIYTNTDLNILLVRMKENADKERSGTLGDNNGQTVMS